MEDLDAWIEKEYKQDKAYVASLFSESAERLGVLYNCSNNPNYLRSFVEGISQIISVDPGYAPNAPLDICYMLETCSRSKKVLPVLKNLYFSLEDALKNNSDVEDIRKINRRMAHYSGVIFKFTSDMDWLERSYLSKIELANNSSFLNPKYRAFAFYNAGLDARHFAFNTRKKSAFKDGINCFRKFVEIYDDIIDPTDKDKLSLIKAKRFIKHLKTWSKKIGAFNNKPKKGPRRKKKSKARKYRPTML